MIDSSSSSSVSLSTKSQRYDRQVRLWGDHGQEALQNSKVCLINATATGAEVLKNLVLPGISSFTIIDGELIDGASVGNNFFLDSQSMGQSKAAKMTELLCELNSDVAGNFVEDDVENILENDSSFFKNFSLVIATQMIPNVLSKLAHILWEYQIPLLVIRSYGFIGYLRLIVKEHYTIERHSENQFFDMRIENPFSSLEALVDTLDFSQMTSHEHSHTPFLLILCYCLRIWRSRYETLRPTTRDEKEEFKRIIRELQRNTCKESLEEENFQEAIQYANKCWNPLNIPHNLHTIFQDDCCENITAESSDFWIVCRALRDFFSDSKQQPHHSHQTQNQPSQKPEDEGASVETTGNLPLAGTLPDMASNTVQYVALLSIFHEKAKQDFETVRTKVNAILSQSNSQRPPIDDFFIKLMCQNAAYLDVIRTSSLKQEWSFAGARLKEMMDCLEDVEMNTVFYCALRGVDLFYEKHKRFPGTFIEDPEEDVGLLFSCINSWFQDAGISPLQSAKLDILHEICRFGNSEPHCLAALMGGIASQEAIKVLTHQYIPLNNTLVYNGIDVSASVYCL